LIDSKYCLRKRLYELEWTFDDLTALLARHGYSQDEHIAMRLSSSVGENGKLEPEVVELQQQKVRNQAEDVRNVMIGSSPVNEDTKKSPENTS
jgi:hypothetical protein